MSMTDPIADMLTRIRNAQNAKLIYVDIPFSKIKFNIIEVLLDEGYIASFEKIEKDDNNNFPFVRIKLKYTNGDAVIRNIQRISKPGRRIFKKCNDLGFFYGGLGTYIISTSKGVLSDFNARKHKVGGEVLCKLF